MAPLLKPNKALDDATVHSFLLPWRRTHKTWPMSGTRSPDWNRVTCAACLKHRPIEAVPGAPKKAA
jgi:hypothetical protein